jgi:hypothetical protein
MQLPPYRNDLDAALRRADLLEQELTATKRTLATLGSAKKRPGQKAFALGLISCLCVMVLGGATVALSRPAAKVADVPATPHREKAAMETFRTPAGAVTLVDDGTESSLLLGGREIYPPRCREAGHGGPECEAVERVAAKRRRIFTVGRYPASDATRETVLFQTSPGDGCSNGVLFFVRFTDDQTYAFSEPMNLCAAHGQEIAARRDGSRVRVEVLGNDASMFKISAPGACEYDLVSARVDCVLHGDRESPHFVAQAPGRVLTPAGFVHIVDGPSFLQSVAVATSTLYPPTCPDGGARCESIRAIADTFERVQVLGEYPAKEGSLETTLLFETGTMGNACAGGPLFFVRFPEDGTAAFSEPIDYCGGPPPTIERDGDVVRFTVPAHPPNRGTGVVGGIAREYSLSTGAMRHLPDPR